jgi:hypothetical protein
MRPRGSPELNNSTPKALHFARIASHGLGCAIHRGVFTESPRDRSIAMSIGGARAPQGVVFALQMFAQKTGGA